MSIEYQPLKSVSLSQQIADKIREAIANGDLKAEEQLPSEGDLANLFSVSRPTIREALKRLAAQNLVRSKRGPAGGTFINRPSQHDLSTGLTSALTLLVGIGEFKLEEISIARRELEGLCCRLAAENRQDEQLETMRRELELQGQEELSSKEFCASGVRFHHAIAEATGNGILRLVMFSIIEAIQPVANMVASKYSEREVIIGQHQLLLDALEKQQPDQAKEIIQSQVDYLHEQQLKAQIGP